MGQELNFLSLLMTRKFLPAELAVWPWASHFSPLGLSFPPIKEMPGLVRLAFKSSSSDSILGSAKRTIFGVKFLAPGLQGCVTSGKYTNPSGLQILCRMGIITPTWPHMVGMQ